MHEDCERLERLVVADFKNDVKGHREKLAQGHRVRRMLDQLQAQSSKLVRGLPQQNCSTSRAGPWHTCIYRRACMMPCDTLCSSTK